MGVLRKDFPAGAESARRQRSALVFTCSASLADTMARAVSNRCSIVNIEGWLSLHLEGMSDGLRS